MKRKGTRFIITYMHHFGIDIINDSGTSNAYYVRLIVISLLLSLLASILAYINKNQNQYKYVAYSSAFSLEVINTEATYLYFLALKKRIRILLENIDANIFIYANEGKITPTYSPFLNEDNLVLFFIIILAYLIVSIIFAFLSPFLTYLLTRDPQIYIYVVPVWLPFESIVGIYLFQIVTVLALGGVLYAKWIFSSFLLFEYERQCKRLCIALKTLEDRSLVETQQRMNAKDGGYENNELHALTFDKSSSMSPNRLTSPRARGMMDVNFRNAYSKIVQENLIQCIRHHQSLVELQKLFDTWFIACLTTHLLLYTMIVGIMAYYITQPLTIGETFSTAIAFLVAVVDSLAMGFVGERFSNIVIILHFIHIVHTGIFTFLIGTVLFRLAQQHYRIRDTIFYETNWYQQPLEIKRLLKMFHMLVAQKSFTLRMVTTIEMGYRTFGNQCQYSYKYYNILRTGF